MNPALAKDAIASVYDDNLDRGNPNYLDDPGVKAKAMCSRFARCANRKTYGPKYQGLFGGSAIATGRNMQDAGVTVQGKPQLGDYLIKMTGSGGFGHIGIFVGDVPGIGKNMMADNSSTKKGRVSGAKGFRPLREWGDYDLIARLPAPLQPESVYRLFLNDRFICPMPLQVGRAFCPAYRWAEALGFELGWDDETKRVLMNGREINTESVLIEGHAYVPIRDLVEASGLQLLVHPTDAKVVVTR